MYYALPPSHRTPPPSATTTVPVFLDTYTPTTVRLAHRRPRARRQARVARARRLQAEDQRPGKVRLRLPLGAHVQAHRRTVPRNLRYVWLYYKYIYFEVYIYAHRLFSFVFYHTTSTYIIHVSIVYFLLFFVFPPI